MRDDRMGRPVRPLTPEESALLAALEIQLHRERGEPVPEPIAEPAEPVAERAEPVPAGGRGPRRRHSVLVCAGLAPVSVYVGFCLGRWAFLHYVSPWLVAGLVAGVLGASLTAWRWLSGPAARRTRGRRRRPG